VGCLIFQGLGFYAPAFGCLRENQLVMYFFGYSNQEAKLEILEQERLFTGLGNEQKINAGLSVK
jgi:hypothetical protein